MGWTEGRTGVLGACKKLGWGVLWLAGCASEVVPDEVAAIVPPESEGVDTEPVDSEPVVFDSEVSEAPERWMRWYQGDAPPQPVGDDGVLALWRGPQGTEHVVVWTEKPAAWAGCLDLSGGQMFLEETVTAELFGVGDAPLRLTGPSRELPVLHVVEGERLVSTWRELRLALPRPVEGEALGAWLVLAEGVSARLSVATRLPCAVEGLAAGAVVEEAIGGLRFALVEESFP